MVSLLLDWQAFALAHDSIIELHKRLMKNIDERIGYRTEDVHVFKSRFDSTPAQYVKTDMDVLLKWYRDSKSKLHPIVLAALFHHKFEKIHPFSDGNGRTGRVLMNHILHLAGYPPTIITKRFREDYLSAMNNADKALNKSLTAIDSREYKKLIDFSVSELKISYWDIFLV